MSGRLTTTTKKESCMNTFPGREKCFRTCASGIIKMQLHGNVGVPCSAKNYC